jgi:hypothetical protein
MPVAKGLKRRFVKFVVTTALNEIDLAGMAFRIDVETHYDLPFMAPAAGIPRIAGSRRMLGTDLIAGRHRLRR